MQAGSTAAAKSRPGKASSSRKASVVGLLQVGFAAQEEPQTTMPTVVHTGREVEAV